METLQQLCPQCSRKLELPATAAGKMAQCPACNSTFRFEPSEDESASSAAPNEPDQSTDALTETSNTSPSEPTVASLDERSDTGLAVVPIEIEEVLSSTQSIYWANWKPTLVCSFIVCLVCGGMLYATIEVGVNIATMFNRAVFTMCALPVVLVVSMYGLLGLYQVMMAVARDQHDPLSVFLLSKDQLLRAAPGYLVLAVCYLVAQLLLIMMPYLAAELGLANLFTIAKYISIVGSIALLPIMLWYFWAWPMLACDGKYSPSESFSLALRLSMGNQFVSFLMAIAATALMIVGTMCVFVGHIFTLPFIVLMYTVAYLSMTDQPFVDPKQREFFQAAYDEPELQRQDRQIHQPGDAGLREHGSEATS